MSNNTIITIGEMADRFGFEETYESCIAYFSLDNSAVLANHSYSGRISFYQLMLVEKGVVSIVVLDNQIDLCEGDLIILLPYQSVTFLETGGEFKVSGLLVDAKLFEGIRSINLETDVLLPHMHANNNLIYHLNDGRAGYLASLFEQMRRAISQSHIYKMEIIKSLLHVLLLYLYECPYETSVFTHDFKHKENIYKIFVHLAGNNFKKERQIRFYADKLNITTTYLSRMVREISGMTVGEHLSLLAYNEACNLLRNSELTIGEISDELCFSDQSAFTYFFKNKSGMSPTAYRNSEIQ